MLKTKQVIKQGFTIIELLIVIAIIAILALLVLNNFQGAQAKARDTQRRTDMNNVHGKLEEYYNETGGYPNENLTTTLLAGMDAGSIEDADGDSMAFTFSTGTTPVDPTTDNQNEYAYAAWGCSAATTTPTTPTTPTSCTKYVLETFIEKPAGSDPAYFQKNSLN
jgi:prepilin-type N-terminal cleavage/methylation domain-containing protein